jgi:DNA-binding NarL/FixJ family response regulator
MTAHCPLCHQAVSRPAPVPAAWLIRTPLGRESRLSARLVEVAQALHDAHNQIEAAGVLGVSRATLQRERSRLLAALDVETLQQAIALLVDAQLVRPSR